jgi:hypothetical protein
MIWDWGRHMRLRRQSGAYLLRNAFITHLTGRLEDAYALVMFGRGLLTYSISCDTVYLWRGSSQSSGTAEADRGE